MHEKNTKNFKQYLIYMGIGFICSVGSLVIINIIVDPAHILASKNQEKYLAELVNNGKNFSGTSDFNERIFQLFRISLMNKEPDNIIIGSSRAMQIRGAMFSGYTVNNAVSGASLEDYYSIIQMYRERNILPKRVILVADGWLFNVSNKQSRWVTYRNKCNVLAVSLGQAGLCPPGTGDINGQTWREFVSLGYLRESIKRLLRDGTSAVPLLSDTLGYNFIPTDKFPLIKGGRLADGSSIYPQNSRTISLADLEYGAAKFAKASPVYSLGGFYRLEPIYTQGFEALLTFLTSQGIEVSILLPPYHPTASRILKQNKTYAARLYEAEAFIHAAAQKRGMLTFGGYFSDACEAKDFYDGQHPRQLCMAKLLNVKIPNIYKEIDNDHQ